MKFLCFTEFSQRKNGSWFEASSGWYTHSHHVCDAWSNDQKRPSWFSSSNASFFHILLWSQVYHVFLLCFEKIDFFIQTPVPNLTLLFTTFFYLFSCFLVLWISDFILFFEASCFSLHFTWASTLSVIIMSSLLSFNWHQICNFKKEKKKEYDSDHDLQKCCLWWFFGCLCMI